MSTEHGNVEEATGVGSEATLQGAEWGGAEKGQLPSLQAGERRREL